MIRTLIFDFGDVFIDLDIEGAIQNMLGVLNLKTFDSVILDTNKSYEKGLISTEEFLEFYFDRFPQLSKSEIISTWNQMIKNFPKYRLNFIKKLSAQNRFNLILLSNTNELHIGHVKNTTKFYDTFKSQFDKFYLSHEIQMRKPDPEIFKFVLDQNSLKANECLFIDDSCDNINTAKALGFNTWHIDPKTDDVIHLFNSCSSLF